MKRLFSVAPLALAITATPVMAQDTEQTLERMQQQLNAMQQQLNSARNTGVRFNGFFSTGYARASNDAGYAGITEESEVKDLSLFALQGTFDVTQKSQIVMQLVGRGADDWEPKVEWAYLSHRPTNNLQLRAGKMRLPFFMYSDSLEVGYAQPWARPPQSVYGPIAVTSYVGADASYNWNFDNSSLNANFFTGFTDEDGNSGDVQLRNIAGLNLTWTDYVWTVRGIAATAEADIDATRLAAQAPAGADVNTVLADGDRGNFYGIGASYDNGNWQIIGELTRVEVDGKFADTDSAYLSIGHRFGSWTPYIALGWVESKDDDERLGFVTTSGGTILAPESILNFQREDYSVGTRWDITPGVAIKADITHSRGFDKGTGNLNPSYILTSGTNSTNVYTLKLESAF
ncbi:MULTISPECIES: hypothetical protein [unclassified Marinobacter]|uniref:hypothetical protein n=1 Tax=unclassified Marinobacter TaxID=83889 RepID=UPI0012679D70|nr:MULTISPECIES: hypothetical protein [unclassified Marinobacter]QFS88738.1 hypothetical protein FIV08_18015 [Marinobacter sp. THAF197a]QFT52523.1 hypothetical protein FIU96_17920 [Marinobacter sp. THAF39]